MMNTNPNNARREQCLQEQRRKDKEAEEKGSYIIIDGERFDADVKFEEGAGI